MHPPRRPADESARDGLAGRILASRNGQPATTTLQTDEKVLARVTDGIYRKPSSALRELISNAYDADATEVVIQTDRPRFDSIVVSDNGHGMSPAAVAHMIEHIGGSAKRSAEGADLGVTHLGDRFRSPGGRRLIGRIGIGLFSVSQLVHSFQIITKVADDPWRTVARVRMKTYADETNPESLPSESEGYEAGKVSIWQVPAADVAASGTTIILSGIRDHARQTLASRGRWSRVRRNLEPPPAFHVGEVQNDLLVTAEGEPSECVPWSKGDTPAEAFGKLVEAVWDRLRQGASRNPSIDNLMDTYLQTVWELGLSAPLPYVGREPFQVSTSDAHLYALVGAGPDGAIPLTTEGRTLQELLSPDPTGPTGSIPFRVLVDDLELRRPIKVAGLPTTSHAITKPIVFGGGLREEFAGSSAADSGGPLKFDAYVMWAPKIAPVEHNGVLIRVHGASGTLFDRSFLNYQIAELTRLRQLTCEIFVHEGFEAALNIDREGFNHAHPHALRLTSWLHTAITRAINEEKALANAVNRRARADAEAQHVSGLEALVASTWERRQGPDEPVPPVRWGRRPRADAVDEIVVDPMRIFGRPLRNDRPGRIKRQRFEAITQVLAAYNLLEDLEDEEAAELLASIGRILAEDS